MVVVIILGILAATIIPQFAGTTQDAKIKKAKADVAILSSALERYFLHMDRYPSTEEGLRVLVTPPADGADRWRGSYVRELQPDPWGNPYQYRSPGTRGPVRTYDLWSNGADGAEGGEALDADIGNWTTE
jgi:general secretion pathway protein G